MNQSLIAHHSLSIALFFAVLIHALMMFYIKLPKTEQHPFSRDLDVVIVNSVDNQPIEDKHFLAQQNQQGAAEQTQKAQNLASIKAQKVIKPVKPTPVKDIKQAQSIKPMTENKNIIKTPPPVKSTPLETKRIIHPPEPIKPKPIQHIEWSKPVEMEDEPTTLPVEKLSPIVAKTLSPTGLVKPKEIDEIEKINHAIKETVHDEEPDTQTPKKLEKHEKPEKPEKPVKETPKNSQTKNLFSATALAQQISDYGSTVQQDAIKNQNKVKSVNQVTTHKYMAAQYLKDWESKVERTGNVNYPAAAMKAGFSATLTMEVYINMDGSIKSMSITHSSGNKELDNAAKKIVQMSAPFPPLPNALHDELEVLKITRVWKFSDESGLITQ